MTKEKRDDMIMHEAFVQGFIAARKPVDDFAALDMMDEANKAYADWRKSRTS